MNGTRARGEDGRAEYFIVLIFFAVIGFAFLWALVLHDEPPRHRAHSAAANAAANAAATTATTAPNTPVSLPPPRRYKTTGPVNIRQGPATNTTVLGRLKPGDVIVVECRITGESVTASVGTSDQWLRILTPVGSGYVSAVYVDVSDDLDNAKRLGLCTKV